MDHPRVELHGLEPSFDGVDEGVVTGGSGPVEAGPVEVGPVEVGPLEGAQEEAFVRRPDLRMWTSAGDEKPVSFS